MNIAWVVIALAAVAASVAYAAFWRRSGNGDGADLGTVSNQWISEHRLGSGQDSRR